jgi:hypothetical protein
MRKDGVIWTQVLEIERVTDLQGNTQSFTLSHTGNGGYRAAYAWIDKEVVPHFEGRFAWAEVQKVSSKPWPFHRVVRLVDPPQF